MYAVSSLLRSFIVSRGGKWSFVSACCVSHLLGEIPMINLFTHLFKGNKIIRRPAPTKLCLEQL